MAKPVAEDIFTRIYRGNLWSNAESRSGHGSTVSRTDSLRPRLTALCRQLAVASLLDMPCGDFNWMRLTDLPGVDYTGADIVPEMIARNNSLYAHRGRRFVKLNMCSDALPRVDLVLCREGWVHLSFSDIAAAIRKLKQSRSSHLLTTTFTAWAKNKDIVTGDWRPLNLDLAPFRFARPISVLPDAPLDGSYADKALALYRVADLPDIDSRFGAAAAIQRSISRARTFRIRLASANLSHDLH
jgi:hypothetical protein